MTAGEFLEILWQYKPEEHFILIWTGQDKRSHWFQDIAAAAAFVESEGCQGKCVFVGIGASKTDNGPTRRCTSNDIASLCAVWTDLDLACEAHKDKALPASLNDAVSILPKDMPPTITVGSGNGAHAWWVFKEPHVFDSEEDRRRVVAILNRWHTLIRYRCAARGWAYDRLSDLARVARVVGTTNMKEPANPKPVVVLARTDRRYHLSDFEEYVDDAGIPDLEKQESAAREWAARFKEKPLAINPAARIPQQLLDAWMDPKNSDEQTASRFRNTWERRRHDLKDPSQSGYDLALADFGVIAGLSDQQIVDLICHHRAMHGQKQRTRVDYFERTLARASERNPDAPASAAAPITTSPTGAPAGAISPQEAPPAIPPPAIKEMSEEDKKAALCAEISQQIGAEIPITRLVKITGKDPSFRMELADGKKIEFVSVKTFRNQEAVRDALAAQTGWLMPPIKPKVWHLIAQKMLRACIEEEGPIEAQWEASTIDVVTRYLGGNGFIEDIATAHESYRHRPIVKDGFIAISTRDLAEWMNRTLFEPTTAKSLASRLAAIGATPRRITGKFPEQSRYLLPLAKFDPANWRKARLEAVSKGGDDAAA